MMHPRASRGKWFSIIMVTVEQLCRTVLRTLTHQYVQQSHIHGSYFVTQQERAAVKCTAAQFW